METACTLVDPSKEDEDEMQPDVVWEGITKLFDYPRLASTWPLTPSSEGHKDVLVDWLESSDEASHQPPPLNGMNQPSASSKDDSTSLVWNDIEIGSTGPVLQKTISASSTESSVLGETELKRQRRKQQNRKSQQAYRARQEGRMKQLEEALSTATLQLRQYEEMIEQLRVSLQHPRQLGRSNSN